MLGLKSSTWTYICVCVHVYPHAHTHTNHTHTQAQNDLLFSVSKNPHCVTEWLREVRSYRGAEGPSR